MKAATILVANKRPVCLTAGFSPLYDGYAMPNRYVGLLSPLSACRIALLGRQWETVSRAAEVAIPAPEGYGESGG